MKRRRLLTNRVICLLMLGAVVGLAASRVNRRLLPEAPQREPVLHEVIADVAIDPRTFKRAVESLSSKTSAKLVIDEELMPAVEAEEATLGDNAAPQIQRFHDVQLGILLVRLLARWEDQMSMDCRIDGRTITFCTPRVAGAIERRCYDLRRFTKDWVAWSDLAWSWGPRGGRGGGGRWGSGGAITGESVDERAAERLVQFFRDQVVRDRSADFEVIASWAGCVIVEAPRESHNQFARFLEMWASSPAIREMPVGRSGFPRVLAERFLSPARLGNDVERLSKIISTVKCKAMPLEKFMDAIADATGSAFYADWHQLAGGAAVGPLSPVTLDLKNVSAGDALQQALDQCRLTGSRLGFVSVDGLVTVSMQSRMDRSRTTSVYDARDLIKKAAENNLKIAGPRPIPQDDEEFVLPNVKFQMNSENAAADNIRSGLLASVSNSASSGLCEISYFSGRFAIAGTIQQHELIAAALGAMRAKVEQDLKWQR